MFKRKSQSLTSHIGAKMEIHGDIFVDEALHIEGILHGSVESYETLEIAPTGLVEGKEVKGRKVIVKGILKAEKIFAEDSIVITRTGRVEGEIFANSIAIEEGATIHASMKSQEVPALEPVLEDTVQFKSSLNFDPALTVPIIREWNRDDFFVAEAE